MGPRNLKQRSLGDSGDLPGIWTSVVQAFRVADNVCTTTLFAFLSLQNYDEGTGANTSSHQNGHQSPIPCSDSRCECRH